MTFSVYFPGGKPLNSYVPCEFVWVVSGEPAGGVITTVALVTAAPEGSVTCPRRTPELDWANERFANRSNERNVIKRLAYLSNFIPGSTFPTKVSADTRSHPFRGRHLQIAKATDLKHRHQPESPNSRATTSWPGSRWEPLAEWPPRRSSK